jgi:hypothetical protein
MKLEAGTPVGNMTLVCISCCAHALHLRCFSAKGMGMKCMFMLENT